MNKKVLIISSSPRKGGNSEMLAAALAEGAQAAGHQVETVYLREKQIGYCKGCFACHKLGHCVLKDDAAAITAKMHDAGRHSVRRRRKRRGRDRRASRTGTGLSDGKGSPIR